MLLCCDDDGDGSWSHLANCFPLTLSSQFPIAKQQLSKLAQQNWPIFYCQYICFNYPTRISSQFQMFNCSHCWCATFVKWWWWCWWHWSFYSLHSEVSILIVPASASEHSSFECLSPFLSISFFTLSRLCVANFVTLLLKCVQHQQQQQLAVPFFPLFRMQAKQSFRLSPFLVCLIGQPLRLNVCLVNKNKESRAALFSCCSAALLAFCALRRAEKNRSSPVQWQFPRNTNVNSIEFHCRLQVLASFLLLLFLPFCLSVCRSYSPSFPFDVGMDLFLALSFWISFFSFIWKAHTHTQTNRLIY